MFTFCFYSKFVAKPPAFTSQLISTSIVEGNAAELSVSVVGFPKPEVTWYLDGLPVRNDINHRVVWDGDNVSLNIAPAVIDDEGIYTVKAVNALGSATCQAEFIVECKYKRFERVVFSYYFYSYINYPNKRPGCLLIFLFFLMAG